MLHLASLPPQTPLIMQRWSGKHKPGKKYSQNVEVIFAERVDTVVKIFGLLGRTPEKFGKGKKHKRPDQMLLHYVCDKMGIQFKMDDNGLVKEMGITHISDRSSDPHTESLISGNNEIFPGHTLFYFGRSLAMVSPEDVATGHALYVTTKQQGLERPLDVFGDNHVRDLLTASKLPAGACKYGQQSYGVTLQSLLCG